MTRAQVARRRFKSGLPRKIESRDLSPMEALARTMGLFDSLRSEMQRAGLSKDDVKAALVFYQPNTKGREHVIAETRLLPKPEDIPQFCEAVLSLDSPVFLGVLFQQEDHEARKAGDTRQATVMFGCELTKAHNAEARLLAARNQLLEGGFKKAAN